MMFFFMVPIRHIGGTIVRFGERLSSGLGGRYAAEGLIVLSGGLSAQERTLIGGLVGHVAIERKSSLSGCERKSKR